LLFAAHRKEVEAKREQKNKEKKKSRIVVEEEEVEEEEIKLVIPPAPRLEDEVVDVSEEDVPMYFTEPQQLMGIFSALEEQNLFLIQNTQETERILEELRHAFTETKTTMDAQSLTLQIEIDTLLRELATEDGRLNALRVKRAASAAAPTTSKAAMGMQQLQQSSSTVAGTAAVKTTILSDQMQIEKERLLSILNSKVRHLYDISGFDASSKPSTLYMLSQVESKLEELIGNTQNIPDEFMERAEKDKEKKRRELKRVQQQEQQEKQQE